MESRQQQRQQELAGHGRLCILLLCFVLFLTGTLCQAEDRAQESVAATNTAGLCRFAVALPEMEGPLTLGIFSPDGNLVRLLYRDAAIENIPAGLNGLLIAWDGKDDHGVEVPAGVYRARGIVHGKLAASAIPYSDSDWHSARLQETNQPAFLPMSAPMQSPLGSNQIAMTSAPDALYERRCLLAIQTQLQESNIVVTAEGLPILTIPLTVPKIHGNRQVVELHYGSHPGTAELTVTSPDGKSSYLLSGLDQLVPLDAGTLPMPSDSH